MLFDCCICTINKFYKIRVAEMYLYNTTHISYCTYIKIYGASQEILLLKCVSQKFINDTTNIL